MTDAVVYKLYSHRPLNTAANQQLAVSTGTIVTYFGNLATPCGCLHTEVHEVCVRAYGAPNVTKIMSFPTYLSLRIKSAYAHLCLHMQTCLSLRIIMHAYADISLHMRTCLSLRILPSACLHISLKSAYYVGLCVIMSCAPYPIRICTVLYNIIWRQTPPCRQTPPASLVQLPSRGRPRFDTSKDQLEYLSAMSGPR